jgi:hypothetical protein
VPRSKPAPDGEYLGGIRLRSEAEVRKARADAATEAPVERYFMDRAKAYGCKQRKITQFYAEDGWPDRIIVWPGGATHYVELKRPKGGKLRPRQETIIGELTELGAVVEVLSTRELVDAYFATWAKTYGIAKAKPPRRKSSKLVCADEL